MKIFTYVLSLVFFSLLTGCATTPDPVIQTVIQKVEVPIAVPCSVTIPPAPAFGFGTLTETDSLYLKVQTLLSDRQLHLGYESLLLGALEFCTKK